MFVITECRAHFPQLASHEKAGPFAEARPLPSMPPESSPGWQMESFLLLTKRNVLKVNLFIPAPFRQQFWCLTASSVRNGNLIKCKVDATELTAFQRSWEPWPWASFLPDSTRPRSLPHRLGLAETLDSEQEQTSASAQELLGEACTGQQPALTRHRSRTWAWAGLGGSHLCPQHIQPLPATPVSIREPGITRGPEHGQPSLLRALLGVPPPCTAGTRRPEFQARATECCGVRRVLGAGMNTSLPTVRLWANELSELLFSPP